MTGMNPCGLAGAHGAHRTDRGAFGVVDCPGVVELPDLAQVVQVGPDPGRPMSELADSGLLWLINAAVFHPRGYALTLAADLATGEVVGWALAGDGRAPWRYDDDGGQAQARFEAAEATLAAAALDGADAIPRPQDSPTAFLTGVITAVLGDETAAAKAAAAVAQACRREDLFIMDRAAADEVIDEARRPDAALLAELREIAVTAPGPAVAQRILHAINIHENRPGAGSGG